MGILLPPVSQVTSCHSILNSTSSTLSTINTTNHVAPVHPPGHSLSIYTGTYLYIYIKSYKDFIYNNGIYLRNAYQYLKSGPSSAQQEFGFGPAKDS